MSALVERAPASPPASRPLHFHTSTHPLVRKWLIGLTILLVVGWLVTGAIFAHFWWRQRTAASPLPTPTAEQDPAKPWGQLITVPIMIAPPLEFMPETAPADDSQVVWHFSGMSVAPAGELLRESGISNALVREAASEMEMDPATGNTVVRPSRELVLGLSPDDRAKLYVALSGFRENADQANAFRVRGTSFDQWTDHADLTPDSRKLIEPLVYATAATCSSPTCGASSGNWTVPSA